MKRILGYAIKYWYIYALAALILFVSTLLDMYNPIITMRLVDDVIRGQQYNLFEQLMWLLVIITMIRVFLGYFREIFFDVVGVKITYNLRKDLFRHLQKLSYSYYDHMNTGKIMSRIKEDGDNVFRTFSFGIMLIVDNVLYFVMALFFMMRINVIFTIVSLIIVPIIGYVALTFEKKMQKVYGDISDETAKLNTIAQENIAGVRLVKAFAREKHEIKKFLERNHRFYELHNRHAITVANHFPKIEFLTNLLIIMVTLLGGVLVLGDQLSLGKLIAFSGYINMLIFPMRNMGWLAGLLAECRASVKKLDKIFAAEPEIQNAENAMEMKECKGSVEFKNVSFGYNEGTDTIKDINIKVKEGHTLAVMGATGSGKSTLLHLLTRHYNTENGVIKIDGHDIKELDMKDLRKSIGVVMQDTFLLSETIEENIKFGADHISLEDVKDAAEKAEVHSFVDAMVDGYDTVIGERGVGLSGGQKQRIAIARALATKPPILVMDDATSALDMETEENIHQAIKAEKSMTKIIIAHRISAVKDADEIIILNDGEIVERGNHFSLLSKKGQYYNIYQQQYEGLLQG